MAINPPALDDRTFSDLSAELVARIPAHTPEWTNPVAGDPGRTLLDLVAWLGDALLYRVNLIPERQRLAFLALLGQQLNPAQPAQGLVSLAPGDPSAALAVTLAQGATVTGPVNFETLAEVTVLPITGQCYAKQALSDADRAKLQDTINGLSKLYKINAGVAPYQTTAIFNQNLGDPDGFDVKNMTVDQRLWIALLAGPQADVAAVTKSFGSGSQQMIINVGFVPVMTIEGVTANVSGNQPPLAHSWQISLQSAAGSQPQYATLQEIADTTSGLTARGVVRLALPQASDIGVPANDVHADYQAGVGLRPPRIDDPSVAKRLVAWLSLQLTDAATVSWLGVNAVQVDQRQTAGGKIVGVSDGSGDQIFSLGQPSIDPTTLELQVDMPGTGYADWSQVDDLATASTTATVFELDAEAGTVQFGNGIQGAIPGTGRRVRIASMRFGGGAAGNLPAQSLTGITGYDLSGKPVSGLQVSQPVPMQGGADAEALEDAESRIPAMLRHRDRAVTTADYQALASTTPGASIGRVEVMPLFHPQNFQDNVPGVVSVMVLPARDQVSLPNPRPDNGLLNTVSAYLQPRKPLATELYIIGCDYVGIGLSVGIEVRDGYGPDTVSAQVAAALKNTLWPLPPGGYQQTGYALGRTVRALELQVIAAGVPGVDEVTGINLFQQLPSGVYQQVVTPSSTQAELPLESYQLPELLAISVSIGSPASSLDPNMDSGDSGTPIPVIPEVC